MCVGRALQMPSSPPGWDQTAMQNGSSEAFAAPWPKPRLSRMAGMSVRELGLPAFRCAPCGLQMLAEKLHGERQRAIGLRLAKSPAAVAGKGVVGLGIFVDCHERVG